MERKKIIAVLGVSRSGTSAIAKGLNVLGVDFGNKLLQGDKRNPKGFFEDAEILYDINRGLTRALSDAQINIHALSKDELISQPLIQNYKLQAAKLLKQRLENKEYWGFKDPRTMTILPFWQQVFAALDVEDRYVITLRHPLAVAYSTKKFINLDLELGLMVWLRYLMLAIDGTNKAQRVVVCYERMLQNPKQQLHRMHQALSLTTQLNQDNLAHYANEFLDDNLDHHEFNEKDLHSHAALKIVPLCIKVYELLMQLADDQLSFESEAFKAAWQQIHDEFTTFSPIYTYIETLFNRYKQLERNIRAIERSLPWKLIFPLRYLQEIFHHCKRSLKEKRRLEKIYE